MELGDELGEIVHLAPTQTLGKQNVQLVLSGAGVEGVPICVHRKNVAKIVLLAKVGRVA